MTIKVIINLKAIQCKNSEYSKGLITCRLATDELSNRREQRDNLIMYLILYSILVWCTVLVYCVWAWIWHRIPLHRLYAWAGMSTVTRILDWAGIITASHSNLRGQHWSAANSSNWVVDWIVEFLWHSGLIYYLQRSIMTHTMSHNVSHSKSHT